MREKKNVLKEQAASAAKGAGGADPLQGPASELIYLDGKDEQLEESSYFGMIQGYGNQEAPENNNTTHGYGNTSGVIADGATR